MRFAPGDEMYGPTTAAAGVVRFGRTSHRRRVAIVVIGNDDDWLGGWERRPTDLHRIRRRRESSHVCVIAIRSLPRHSNRARTLRRIGGCGARLFPDLHPTTYFHSSEKKKIDESFFFF